jgi:predicted RNA-binding Zn-ribbon protein involved in translation (DUF1610 family)
VSSDDLTDLCSDCGTELGPLPEGAESMPCPTCGSTRRTHRVAARAGGISFAGGTARVLQTRAWDAASLTLAGVVYGVIITVVGVVVATLGTLATVVYAVFAIALLAAGLLIFPQPVISAMRWLLERAKRKPLDP